MDVFRSVRPKIKQNLLQRASTYQSSRSCAATANATNYGTRPSESAFRREPTSSIDVKEAAKFAAMAETWWDPDGPYRPLHLMNPIRMSFIRSAICRHFRQDVKVARPLEGLTILDVGCGGGLVCEPLARMGGHVTGVDAVEKNINIATIHARQDPSTAAINYRVATAEQLVQEQCKFNVVTALEIIEHVSDPEGFCKSLASLMDADGILIVSTINRSITSFGLAIVAAEYVLGWVPKGTHDWFKLVTPEELTLILHRASINVNEMAGIVYNPFSGKWLLSSDTNCNYILWGTRNG